MSELIRLAITLIEMNSTQRRNVPGGSLCLIIGAGCAAAVLACAVVALWVFLVPRIGPAGAPLVVAGVLLIFGLIFFGIGWSLFHRTQAPVLPTAEIEHLLTQGTKLMGEHKGLLLGAAALAGIMMGAERRRRR